MCDEIGADNAGFVQKARVLVIYLEEEQIDELLHIVALGDAVIAQDVAVVPKALDDGGGLIAHGSGSQWRQFEERRQPAGKFKIAPP